MCRCGREWLWRRLQEFGGTEFNAAGQKPQNSTEDPRYGDLRRADNISHSSGEDFMILTWCIVPWISCTVIFVPLIFSDCKIKSFLGTLKTSVHKTKFFFLFYAVENSFSCINLCLRKHFSLMWTAADIEQGHQIRQGINKGYQNLLSSSIQFQTLFKLWMNVKMGWLFMTNSYHQAAVTLMPPHVLKP